MYFWANGVDWTTTDPAELAACEDFMVNQFAQHIKAFDSYPGINLTQGNYALSQVRERRRPPRAALDPGGGRRSRRLRVWAAVGAPTTELWMDTG